jgi:Tfp pilus assembly protein PilW
MNAAQMRGRRRAGFSLVELIAGILAAAVLALTAGSMLWYGYLGWRRTGEAVALQRDSRVAMDVLTRALRTGTNMTFTTGMVFTVWCPDKPRASVYASGRNLFYVPNMASGGNSMQLIGGTLDRFSISFNSGSSSVLLMLSTPTSSISNRVVVSRRN